MKTDIIAMTGQVDITAAAIEGEERPGPAKFTATFYTGGALEIAGWDQPVVVDLAGLQSGNVLVANLDHDSSKRVGNFTVDNDGKTLVAHGTASAATPARDEVVNSAMSGYVWQASLEVQPHKGGVEMLKAGKTATVNGQAIAGPAYITRKGTLKGFAFVSHGADDNTTASIAAIAASHKEKSMKAEVKQWIEAMGFDVESLTDDQITKLEANYEGQTAKPKKPTLVEGIAAKQVEADRIAAITEIAMNACDEAKWKYNGGEIINAINELAQEALDQKWGVDKFRLELIEQSIGTLRTSPAGGRQRDVINTKVVEAAICMAGQLKDIDKHYNDQTLQTAHDRFRHGIGLKELFVLAAEANGYKQSGYNVDVGVQRAAFGMLAPHQISANLFSTLSLTTALSNVANKFIREGWMAVDQTPLRIAAIRAVRDFKQITTVSLTGGMLFEKLGAGGEIKHKEVSELSYTNQADTYAAMFAITRRDIINDDLGVLTAVPRRLGRGGMLKLNDIFWTEFLNNSAFFTSGNSNVSTDTGALGLTGLQQAETIFMNQTDADGLPLGAQPAIILVPTALKSTALQLMTSEKIKGDADEPDGNVWRGRFRVESSPYMSNTAYTGYSAVAWYLLADPMDIPVIEIAALNGRVEPTVETADADFNVLGVQMRGYSDVGVNLQEYRGGVRADGSAAGG